MSLEQFQVLDVQVADPATEDQLDKVPRTGW
jgi:hypothetical protein